METQNISALKSKRGKYAIKQNISDSIGFIIKVLLNDKYGPLVILLVNSKINTSGQ